MKLAEMKAKLEGLKADASADLDAIEAAGGFSADGSTAAEARYEARKAEIETLKGDIDRAERLAEARRQMGAVASRPALATGVNEPDPARTGGFKHLAEFAEAVRRAATGGGEDRRLLGAPSNVHSGTGGAGEGFLLPAEYREEIWQLVIEDELLQRFAPEPTSARSIEFVRDETTPWGAAGIQAYWRAEGAQMTPDKLAGKAGRIELHDLYVLAAASGEMLDDAPRLRSQLAVKAAQAIRWKAADAVINGSGVGQPRGILGSDALVTVAKESGQAADTIVAANINKMFARQLMIPGGAPFWLANIDTFPQLQALNAGTDAPIFYPPGGIADAPNGTLLGRPIVYSEHAQTVGDKGDIMLIEPGGYYAATRAGGDGGITFATSIHLWFDYNVEAFRWMFRMGGQPILSAPISPANGAATRAHFVALAARA